MNKLKKDNSEEADSGKRTNPKRKHLYNNNYERGNLKKGNSDNKNLKIYTSGKEASLKKSNNSRKTKPQNIEKRQTWKGKIPQRKIMNRHNPKKDKSAKRISKKGQSCLGEI